MSAPLIPEPTVQIAPIATAADAAALAAHYVEIMDTLIGVVQQETELIKKGKLRQAGELATSKADLAQLYVADTARLQACQPQMATLAPATLDAIKRRHDAFHSLLQINLTVLATAHAVSESIVRGVSGEMARKSSPQTYGANGQACGPNPRVAQPLALSRVL